MARMMTPEMVYRITVLTCAWAAVVTAMLIGTSIPKLSPAALIAAAFAAVPYLLLALLAWWQRSGRGGSWLLLAVAVLLSVGGLSLFAYDSYRYHTVAEHRMVQRMTILVVPMLQLAVTAAAGLVLWVKRLMTAHRSGRRKRRR